MATETELKQIVRRFSGIDVTIPGRRKSLPIDRNWRENQVSILLHGRRNLDYRLNLKRST
jgi:hypothetical protein